MTFGSVLMHNWTIPSTLYMSEHVLKLQFNALFVFCADLIYHFISPGLIIWTEDFLSSWFNSLVMGVVVCMRKPMQLSSKEFGETFAHTIKTFFFYVGVQCNDLTRYYFRRREEEQCLKQPWI